MKMTTTKTLTSVPFAVFCLTVLVVAPARTGAGFDDDFCNDLTKDGNKQDMKKPYFYEDFSTLSETSYFETNETKEAVVSHQKLFYSTLNKQAVVLDVTPKDTFWVFIDKKTNDCIYKKNREHCVSEEGDCKKTAQVVGFGNGRNGKIDFSSATERMAYPTNIKKAVTLGDSYVRRIFTTRVAICSYNEDTDETAVTFLNIFDPTKYSNMEKSEVVILEALIYTKLPGEETTSHKRIDFTNTKELTQFQHVNGFSLGEARCGTVKDKFTSKKPPKPSNHFSYVNQQLITDEITFRAFNIKSAEHGYNKDYHIHTIQNDIAVEDEIKKNTIFKTLDYTTKVDYIFSVTNGSCQVKTMSSKKKLESPKSYWELDALKPTYLGVYSNRDIPCDAWRFDNNDKYTKSVTLFTATSAWLESQQLPSDMFYPVQRIEKGDPLAVFEEIYAYKEQSVAYLPYLYACFQEEDVLMVQVTLLENYFKSVAGQYIDHANNIRKHLMKLAGIVSPMRLSIFDLQQSPSAPHSEVNVVFRIMGKYTGFDDLGDDIYKYDPVTSKKAAELIKRAVDKSEATEEKRKANLKFKQGSFVVLGSGIEFYNPYGNSRDVPSGYSGGAMAGVAIALLLLSVALGLAATFGYKRWIQPGGGSSSLGMENMSYKA